MTRRGRGASLASGMEEPTPSFLERLDDEAVALLRAVARRAAFPKGALLVRHGQPASGAYLVFSGSVEAVVRLPSGDEVVVAELGAGEVFGDMAVIERGTYSATVRATSEVDAWIVEGDDFRALAAQRSPAAIRLQHAVTLLLIEKLRKLNASVLACPAPEDRPARAPIGTDPLAERPRTKNASFDFRGFLPMLPFFDGFSERDIAEVITRGALLELPRGHPIFASGQAAEACYLVLRGAVEVTSRYADRERRMAVLGPGQLFGFMSVLDGRGRSTDAYAREATLLLELSGAELEELMVGQSTPAHRVQQAVHRNLLRSLAQTNRMLTRLMSEARLSGARREGDQLEVAYSGQIVAAEETAAVP